MAQEFYLISKNTIDLIKNALEDQGVIIASDKQGKDVPDLIRSIQTTSSSTIAGVSVQCGEYMDAGISTIWVGKYDEYDALPSKPSTTLYIIKD